MRRLTFLLLPAGLAVITALVVRHGAGAIWQAMAAIGWSGLALVGLCHGAVIVLMGLAWHAIVPEPRRYGPGLFIWARLIRDSGAEVLPLSQIGGFVMGARAAMLAGLPGGLAAATTIVDVTLELLAQLAFTGIGLVLLLETRPESGIALPIAVGLTAMALGAAGFVQAQRRGLSLADRIGAHLLGDWVRLGHPLEALQAEIAAIYARPARAWRGSALHLGCWLASAAEAWLALRLMGLAVGPGPVLAVESLLYAVRSAAFFVPNALGVQEGAYLLLGGIFGIPPETLLALSLLKRARDLALGLPALLAWQAAEMQRVLRGIASADLVPQEIRRAGARTPGWAAGWPLRAGRGRTARL